MFQEKEREKEGKVKEIKPAKRYSVCKTNAEESINRSDCYEREERGRIRRALTEEKFVL